MQKKLSKHFIYKWLQEDLYGEYILHHFNNKFSNQLLLNIWSFLNDAKRSQRGALVLGAKSNRLLEFASNSLRYRLLLNPLLIMATADKPLSKKKFLKTKNYFYNTLFLLQQKPVIAVRIQKFLKPTGRVKILLSRRKKFYSNLKNNKIFLNTVKYVWRKSRRVRRSRVLLRSFPREVSKSFKIKNSNRYYKFKNPKVLPLLNKRNYLKKISFIKRYSRKLTKWTNPRIRRFNRGTLRVWRHYFATTLFIYKQKFSLNAFSLSSSLLNLKNYILAFSWDAFAYKLKQKVRKVMQTSKAIRKFLLNTAYAKLKFKGTFQKRIVVVKKNEVSKILSFRLLNYFNLVVTPADLDKIYYNIYYKSKTFQLPTLTALEFNLVPILLRCGFFENGYVVNSLVKRNLFLINGAVVSSNVLLRVWDIISLSKSIWWFVYARFINFFTPFNIISSRYNTNIFKSANFIRQIIKIKNLFKKFDYRTKLSNRGNLSKLIYLKNYVFSLPPAYMEVSYKLFIIVIYRLISKSTDVSVPFNLRGLKTILPNSTRVPSDY